MSNLNFNAVLRQTEISRSNRDFLCTEEHGFFCVRRREVTLVDLPSVLARENIVLVEFVIGRVYQFKRCRGRIFTDGLRLSVTSILLNFDDTNKILINFQLDRMAFPVIGELVGTPCVKLIGNVDFLLRDSHGDLAGNSGVEVRVGGREDYIMANPPFNLKGWYDENLKNDSRWVDYQTPPESNANYAWILHILSHLKALKGVAGFLLANGALGDSDTLEIRKKLIQNDKVEAIIILPRELFITTDISVTLWILNQNKKGGAYHSRMLRSRAGEILFIDLRTWTENPVKNESKKKVLLSSEQIQKAADIYHTWQSEGTDGANYAVPELYRSVSKDEIEKQGWSLVPSKYIEFIDHDLEIDYAAEMSRIQKEMSEVLKQEMKSQKMLEDAFRGIGYGIE